MTEYADPRLRPMRPGDEHHTKRSAALMMRSGFQNGDIAQTAYAAQWLLSNRCAPNAWAEALAFCIDAHCGQGIEFVEGLRQCWANGLEDDNLYSAIIYLCRGVAGEPTPERGVGRLNREADELKCAVLFWYQDRLHMTDEYPEIVPTTDLITPDRLRPLREGENKWYRSLAVSTVHKALRSGDTEMCAYAAGWLLQYSNWSMFVWRRLMAFPSEDISGEGAVRVAALYSAWNYMKEFGPRANNAIFAAIIHLTELVQMGPGYESPLPDTRAELYRRSAEMWFKRELFMPPPPEAFDMHVGQGSVGDFWEYANPMGAPSPWRADAVRMRHEPRPKKNKVDKNLQQSLL